MATMKQDVATTLPMIRSAERDFRKEGSAGRGVALAVRTNGLKAARHAATGVKARPNPATGEPEYTENQTAFMMAVAAWRTRTGVKFPNLCDYLDIAESLGWERQTRTWPSDRVAHVAEVEVEKETVAA